MLLKVFTLLGAVGLFLYGMRMLTTSIQKLCGDTLRKFALRMSGTTIQRILAGFGITATIQSSKETTLMAVSYVNAGMMTVKQSVGMVMGANIGTTITAFLIALLAFVLKISPYCYPIVAVGFIMHSKNKLKNIGELFLGFSLVFLGLGAMLKSVNAFEFGTLATTFFDQWSSYGLGSVLIFLAAGLLITLILQSSLSAISITFILCSMGWIGVPMAAAMVLGENIGTTFAAQYAASDASVQARRAALAHLVFNTAGAIIALIFFKPFTSLVEYIVSGLNPADGYVIGAALFHILFNLFTAIIFIWATGLIEKIVCRFVKEPEAAEEENGLKYITKGVVGTTPDMAILQAFKEVINFSEVCKEGFKYVLNAICETDPDKFEEYRMKLVGYEEITDKFEYEIAGFLKDIPVNEIGPKDANTVKMLYRIVGELESLGDCGENISRVLERERVHKLSFDLRDISNLEKMTGLVDDSFNIMSLNLQLASEGRLENIENAYSIETRINEMRNDLRNQGVEQIEKREDNYQSTSYFLDIISELEAMGDFMINVSQALMKNKD